MNELMNDEAVYRTAPATPGLLNMLKESTFKTETETIVHTFMDILKLFCLKIA